jgi:hypothetical protein
LRIQFMAASSRVKMTLPFDLRIVGRWTSSRIANTNCAVLLRNGRMTRKHLGQRYEALLPQLASRGGGAAVV